MTETELTTLKEERLKAVTREMLGRLEGFSLDRLKFWHLPLLFTEDLPAAATHDILVGKRSPQPENLATKDAFENYLRGIISSKAEAMSRCLHPEPLPEHDVIPATDTPCPAEAAHLSNLKETFFALLKKQVAPADRATVEEWERTFEHTDRIPIRNGNRKSAWRVRQLARKILLKLGIKLGIKLQPQ